jgi:CBS domain-containing protein
MPDGSRSLLCQNDGMQPASSPNTGHAFERQRRERRIRRVKSALAALEDRTTLRSGEGPIPRALTDAARDFTAVLGRLKPGAPFGELQMPQRASGPKLVSTAKGATMQAPFTTEPGPDPLPSFDRATVAEVMRPGVLSCAPEVPDRLVARMMATHDVHAVVVTGVPVAGARDQPILWGVVSDLDLLRMARSREEPLTARELGATEALTVAPECPLPEAVRLMDEHRVRHLVVVDGRRPVGMLSTLDVAGALAWGR